MPGRASGQVVRLTTVPVYACDVHTYMVYRGMGGWQARMAWRATLHYGACAQWASIAQGCHLNHGDWKGLRCRVGPHALLHGVPCLGTVCPMQQTQCT